MATRVQVENVSKKMGATQALQNVGTVFEAGRVHGVVGPNGAGKTTLLRLLAGLLHPDEGDILYERGGQTLTAVQERPHIGYFPQEPSLYPDLSCMEHLNFFRDLYGLNAADFDKRTSKLLSATGMAPFTDRPAGKLSGGMYKKAGPDVRTAKPPAAAAFGRTHRGGGPRQPPGTVGHRVRVCGAGNDGHFKHVLYGRKPSAAPKCICCRTGICAPAGRAAELTARFHAENFADIFMQDGEKHD